MILLLTWLLRLSWNKSKTRLMPRYAKTIKAISATFSDLLRSYCRQMNFPKLKAWQAPDSISTNPLVRQAISDFQFSYLVLKKIHEADFSASWVNNKYVYSDPIIEKAWTTYKDGMIAIKRVSKNV